MKKLVVGSATLICGDSLRVLKTIDDASIDFVFTDPPYGHNNNNGDLIHRWEAALGRPPCVKDSPLARPIANDSPEEAAKVFNGMVEQLPRLLRHGGCCCCCCCCCCGGGPDPQFARWSLKLDEHLAFQQMVVWDKGRIGMGWRYRRSYETVLVAARRGGKVRWFDESKKIENVIRPDNSFGIKKLIPRANDHPTPKPWQLAAHFMRLHTQPNDIVLDPFMGGGSTAEAAIRLGRRFIGIELDQKWFDESVRRARAVLAEMGARRSAA